MRLFGLIGYPLSHSFSKKYFTEKFEREKLEDCRYENFPISAIGELENILQQNSELKGLNVTIPYKESVTAFLNDATDIVKKTGACNCIKMTGNKLIGFNTDIAGFKNSLIKELKPHHNTALILGTGGAAKAVGYVLKTLNISYKFVSRRASDTNLSYEKLNADIISRHTLIINTTPLGMLPDVNKAPFIPYEYLTPEHFLFDLIYNPPKTLFLKKGEECGAAIQNGLKMLEIQAEESWKIWNS